MIDYTEDETINKFIRELLRGRMQPNQVPKQFITKINTALDYEKTIAINKGSIAKVKQIHKIKDDLIRAEQIRNVVSSHSFLPVLHRRSSIIPSYSNEDLEDVLQSMIEGRPLDHDKTNMIVDLIYLSKEKINKLVEEQQFTEAQSYENVLRQLYVINNEVNIEKKHNKKKENYQKLLQEAEESLEMTKNDFKQSLNDFNETANEARQEVIDENQQLLDDFDEETMKGPPPKYFKMSKQYLILREKQKALIKNKNYEEAAGLKAEADELEKIEKQNLIEKFYSERINNRAKLYNDFTSKIKCFDEQVERKRKKLMNNYEVFIQNKQKNIENIQKKYDYTQNLLKDDELKSSTLRSPLKSRKSTKILSQRSKANSSISFSNQSTKVSTSTQTVKRFNFATLKPLETCT